MRTLPITRILASIIITNFASLVILNLFEMKTHNIFGIYVIFGSIIYYILNRCRVKRISLKPDKYTRIMAILTLVALTIPRIPYIIDWLPHTTVLVIADDYARLAELVSMTLSDRYPLRHPANDQYLLSFYYAALYPMVVLKTIFPVITLKNSIFIGCLIYNILILGSLMEIARLLFDNQRSMNIFFFLCTLFGGFDYGVEWWQNLIFSANTQLSSFYTGIFWTVHHFIGFYAIIIAYIVLHRTSFRRRAYKYGIVALLLAGAFYSSPFSFAPLLFFLPHHRTIVLKILRSSVFWLVCLAGIVPLYVFMNKLTGQTFVPSTFRLVITHQFIIDKLLSLPIYVLIVPIIELAAIPLVLYLVLHRMRLIEKKYYISSWIYFLVTYIIAYSGYNNISMRGMFLPTFLWFFLFAKYNKYLISERLIISFYTQRAKRLIIITLAISLANPLYSQFILLKETLANTSLTYAILGEQAPAFIKPVYGEMAHNRQLLMYTPDSTDRNTNYKYNAEKFINPIPIDEMQEWEREILRLPREGFFR